MGKKADAAARLMKGLASPHRLRILCCLADGEKSVGALIAATHIAQTSMSQHLLKLKTEGLVDFRREHRTLFYTIIQPVALELLQVLHKNFCSVASKPKTSRQPKNKKEI